jgi:hypothetical protein
LEEVKCQLGVCQKAADKVFCLAECCTTQLRGAGFGVILAATWLAERTTMVSSNPLEPISGALVTHPFMAAVILALARRSPGAFRAGAYH